MSLLNEQKKSCGPQHFDQELPSADWNVEQLGRFSKMQYSAILNAEEAVTCLYWRLGCALNMARGQFAYGQWEQFLKDTGIDKTRAAKARCIARTFASEQSVEGMTVEDAYENRQRQTRQRSGNRNRAHDDEGDLPEILAIVCELVDEYLNEADTIIPAEVDELLDAVEASLAGLQQLHERLRCTASK